MKEKYRRQAHSVYYTRYHLVFVTKYRRNLFRKGLSDYLFTVLKGITKQYPDIEILEMNTDQDHIHLLVIIPPKYSIADVVRVLKTNTSKAMRKKFPLIKTMYEHNDLGLWSDGYFVSTIGIDEEQIKRYIEYQGQEDKGGAQIALL